MLDLDKIRIDGGTQPRVELNEATVAEYAEAYAAGAEFPPVTVFFDGSNWWLADGFHRYMAALRAGRKAILENITPGSLREAILFAIKANATHGLRRTNADKRRAVEMLLKDEEWRLWSDRAIAEQAGVSDKTVAVTRGALGISADSVRKVERGGTIYTQDTSAIGPPASAESGNAYQRYLEKQGKKPPQGKAKKVPAVKLMKAEAARADAVKAAEDAGHRAEDLDQANQALIERIEILEADNASMVKAFEANDQVAAAVEEAKQLRELNRVLQARVQSMLTEIAALKRTEKALRKKLEQPA